MMILLNSFWSGLAQRRTSIFESLQSCQHCRCQIVWSQLLSCPHKPSRVLRACTW